MLDVRLFKIRRFTGASGAVTLVFFALFGAIFFLTQYLQEVLDYTPLEAGVRMLPIRPAASRAARSRSAPEPTSVAITRSVDEAAAGPPDFGELSERPSGIVNVGGFTAGILTSVVVGQVLDLIGTQDADAFRVAFVLALVPLAHGCYAAYKVNQGEDYRYPFIADRVDGGARRAF